MASAASSDSGMILIKVPRWLSEEWLKAPPEAAVADLDLESGKMQLLGSCGEGRPRNFLVSRRSSPELFAFPVCDENDDVQVEGGIGDALTVVADMNDPSYKTMLKDRHGVSDSARHRSRLEDKIIPLSRSTFLASEVGRDSAESANHAENKRTIWNIIQTVLANHPDGIGCEELLPLLPRMSTFLEVRNALAHMADPLEVDGARRFVARRRTAAEVKTEMKTEAQAALAAKFEKQAKLEMQAKREQQAKLEQKAKQEQRAKMEHSALEERQAKREDVKVEPGTEARGAAASGAGTPRPLEATASKRQRTDR